MGPCRVDPLGRGPEKGICGADRDTIIARNFCRSVVAGGAAHSDHGRDIAKLLLDTARGQTGGYEIKNEKKLKALAEEFGIETKDRPKEKIAEDVASLALAQFGQQEGQIAFSKRAPKGQQEKWNKAGIVPRGIDRDIVEVLHRTHEGTDADYQNIILAAARASLGDGWGGAMLATDLSDVLFGSPVPLRSQANLGILEKDSVNILVHGHEPSLSEMIVAASRDPEIVEFAKKKGAKGIIVAGICCTANEILMRQGCPVAGNFLHQELAILTGAIEMMVVDVQCVMPALGALAARFHTKLISTSKKAKIPGVEHVQFDEKDALEIAKGLVKRAIENYANRDKSKVDIPSDKEDLIAGFTTENIFYHLGGKYRATYRPLNDNIMNGRIRGVVGVVGCNSVKITQDESHVTLVKELIKNDVLVVQTGCSATACAKAGLLRSDKALKLAGPGLNEVCKTVGIPPVLHMGSCVDNSRILTACTEMVREGGLGDDISQLPVAGAAPEQMCDKAVCIGLYCVASGIFTVFSPHPQVLGSPNVTKFLTEGIERITGGKFSFEIDPVKQAKLIIEHLNAKRKALKLAPMLCDSKEERVKAAV
ncbi:MAG: carbon-monoxide dehydrogenase catalytic subunit [Candidatus Omnitrophica bacterium CG1_02_49_10]|nr:MAG: carbon-monoxide dehydrogenase catalytic subunit [Candidatus Omnitrophica bacterium CG1_02_49_10]